MRKYIPRLAVALMALLCGRNIAVAQSSVAPDEHRSLAIYQIMVASFIHGDGGASGYTAMWGPDGHTKNGNLAGVIEALDHIKSLGVNAIWLTPVFDSSTATGGEKLQATGYFTNDYFKIDPHFGSDAEFRRFVDEAHARGLYVILDGVFGHHGGVTAPSPSGHVLDSTVTACDRADGGTGNVSYPASLEYMKDVATYWIDNYGIDGWRLDQAYQAMQGGHNYWLEIRKAVEDLCASRRARGEKWGTLGYMVVEDWCDAPRIKSGVYSEGGLLSAFDFEGKERISGAMQDVSSEGLENGWDDVRLALSPPSARGYLNDAVIPNLFLSNHDGYRLADHFDQADSLYYQKMMTRNAVLAAYSGPVTLYYGDEYADRSLETTGGQRDNIARTSGHLEPRTSGERELKEYIAAAMKFRSENPAMWRGNATFMNYLTAKADILEVTKTDSVSGNEVKIIFSTADTDFPLEQLGRPVSVKAYVPEFVKIR